MNHDLNSLQNLFLLYRERSVTKAAKVAGITQPSMSKALNKLRVQYEDRLFIRQKDELIPTLKTEQLMATLAPLFEKIDRAMGEIEPLRPERATGTFCFSAPDFISKFAMKNLPSGILTTTPKVEFHYRYWMEDTLSLVQSGEVDLAFGYDVDYPNHVKSDVIANDNFVLVARPEHPIQTRVLEEELLTFPYISIRESGFSDEFFDRFLSSKNLARQKVVTSPDIVAAFSLLMKSDYLMVVPSGLARYLSPDCIHYPLPIEDTQLQYCLYWGAVKDQDPLHQFIRSIIRSSFLDHWPSLQVD